MRCRRARPAPAAVLLALAALLLLLLLLLLDSPASPAPRPRPSPAPAPTSPRAQAHGPASPGSAGPPTAPAVWFPAAELTRARYVPGHARAHAELCPARGAAMRLVVLVASAPAHAARRRAVRLTWGHVALRDDVALAFVLGVPPAALRAAIDAEDALYGDIVEGRHVDSYRNLTLKTVSMLEWFVTYCPRAARLLKADDDTFVNVAGVLRFAEAPARARAARTVWGQVWRDARPVRDAGSKFFVPAEEYPGERYPPYANGPAYLVSGSAAGPLLRAALGARWLRMEDALVTGVAAARAQVARADAPVFLRWRPDVERACVLRATLAVHEVSYGEQFDFWCKLNDPNVKCPS